MEVLLPRFAWMNQQLYQVPAQTTKLSALATVRGLEGKAARGANAWGAIIFDANGTSGTRFKGLVGRVF